MTDEDAVNWKTFSWTSYAVTTAPLATEKRSINQVTAAPGGNKAKQQVKTRNVSNANNEKPEVMEELVPNGTVLPSSEIVIIMPSLMGNFLCTYCYLYRGADQADLDHHIAGKEHKAWPNACDYPECYKCDYGREEALELHQIFLHDANPTKGLPTSPGRIYCHFDLPIDVGFNDLWWCWVVDRDARPLQPFKSMPSQGTHPVEEIISPHGSGRGVFRSVGLWVTTLDLHCLSRVK